jgi:hypothetical protein
VEGREDEADISITTRDNAKLASTHNMYCSAESVRAVGAARVDRDLSLSSLTSARHQQ